MSKDGHQLTLQAHSKVFVMIKQMASMAEALEGLLERIDNRALVDSETAKLTRLLTVLKWLRAVAAEIES